MRAYRLLRLLFIIGMSLWLILYFVPQYKPSGSILNAWIATGGVERNVSSFDLCVLLLRTGSPAWGVFYMASVGLELLLIALALRRPRRWVFILGASEQLYFLISFLLRPKTGDLSAGTPLSYLGYAAWSMTLLGFFAKPPDTTRAGEQPFPQAAILAGPGVRSGTSSRGLE